MKVLNLGQHAVARGNAAYFTGEVWMETLATTDTPTRVNMARITFAPGARTFWHRHPLGQVLLVTVGLGQVQRDGEPAYLLRPGDTVVIAAGERHWHGATPEHVFTHIAVQPVTADGQQVDWQEAVSDDDYARADTTA